MDTKKAFLAAALSAAAIAPGEVFRDGDVVVFFGDSITHGGYYHEYITDYYRTRFPEARIRFVNSGIGGDTASGAMPRVGVDVAEYSPTHVAFHFGMNDVGRGNYVAAPSARQLEGAEAAQERYRRNLPELVDMVKKAAPGAKMIYMTPTPYDDTAVPTNIPKGAKGWATVNQKGCNTGLSLMAGYVLASAKKDGAAAVDWFTPLNDFLMRRRAKDPHYMVTRWDRVHPGPLGHSIMAWRFLLSQGAPAEVSDVCVDAAAGQVVKSGNAEVGEVSAMGGGVSFTVLARSLPFPVPPEAGEALAEFKVEERLNRETLSVRGLADGSYALRIDGEEVGTWSAAELARGVGLGFNAKTPQYRQAQAFFSRNAELAAFERTLRGHHSVRWFYGNRAPVDDVDAFAKWFEKNEKDKNMAWARKVPGYLAYWPTYKETRAKLWADQEAARALTKPVPRRYEIVPVKAAGEKRSPAERMDRSKLLVGAYCLQANARTDAHVKAIHDCGVDFIVGVPADRAMLDLFAKHGVGAIVNGVVPGWWGGDGKNAGKMREKNPPGKYAEGVAAFRDHPAIWAVDIGDEPSALDFPYYGEVVRQINKALPGMPLYLNLYPNYASVSQNTGRQTVNQLGTPTYGEHVDVYCRSVPLDYISYDFYPYTAPGSLSRFVSRMYDNFIVVADACRRTKRSFWYIAQVNSRDGVPPTSGDQLRFQANAALSFGAEAITWACWCKGWWTNNVLDSGGMQTEQYEKLSRVNMELKRIGPQYMRFRNVATRFVGFAPDSPERPSLPFGGAQGDARDIRASNGAPLLVGEMTARDAASGRRAFYVTAADDPTGLHPTSFEVVFGFKGNVVEAVGGQGPIPVTRRGDGTCSVPLSSCGGVLLTFE